MVKVISSYNYNCNTTLIEFQHAVRTYGHRGIGLDVETNVVDHLYDRELYLVQFGFLQDDGSVEVFEFDVPRCSPEEITVLKDTLSDPLLLFIIHNAQFEYTVLKYCLDVTLRKVYDTMVAQKCIYNGILTPSDSPFSLAYIVKSLLGIELDKQWQTSYTGEVLVPEQIKYGADDVLYLHQIRSHQLGKVQQYVDAGHPDLTPLLMEVEMPFVLALGEMGFHGMHLDVDMWKKNVEEAKPIAAELLGELSEKVLSQENLEILRERIEYVAECIQDEDKLFVPLTPSVTTDPNKELERLLKVVQLEDEFLLNWRSAPVKKKVLNNLFADKFGELSYTQADLKKWVKFQTVEGKGDEIPSLFRMILAKKPQEELNTEVKRLFLERDGNLSYPQELGVFIPEGTIHLNWGSWQQRLMYFNLFFPLMSGTSKSDIEEYARLDTSNLIGTYKDYIDTTKLITSFGEEFLEHVEGDGKVRVKFIDQVKGTHRISMSQPNLQQIPKGGKAGKKYRKAFRAKPGRKIIMCDYDAAELCILASIAEEQIWIKAIKHGEDLHTANAFAAWGQDFIDAAEPDCEFLKSRQKCNCKKHGEMRNTAKAVAFGTAYGAGPKKVSEVMKSSIAQAKEFLEKFFGGLPSLKSFLQRAREAAVKNNYATITGPYPILRWLYGEPDHRKEKQGSNTAIQGMNAIQCKLALVYIRETLLASNYDAHICSAVHDEILVDSAEECAEAVAEIVQNAMRKSAKVTLGNTLLSATAEVLDSWGGDID